MGIDDQVQTTGSTGDDNDGSISSRSQLEVRWLFVGHNSPHVSNTNPNSTKLFVLMRMLVLHYSIIVDATYLEHGLELDGCHIATEHQFNIVCDLPFPLPLRVPSFVKRQSCCL
jgi:hypothetical protein